MLVLAATHRSQFQSLVPRRELDRLLGRTIHVLRSLIPISPTTKYNNMVLRRYGSVSRARSCIRSIARSAETRPMTHHRPPERSRAPHSAIDWQLQYMLSTCPVPLSTGASTTFLYSHNRCDHTEASLGPLSRIKSYNKICVPIAKFASAVVGAILAVASSLFFIASCLSTFFHLVAKGSNTSRISRTRSSQSKQPAGGYDSTPVARAPWGYTVKITFHRAINLPWPILTQGRRCGVL